jgi:CheY-like chemotaxis protein
MHPNSDLEVILVVEGDAVLGQVLGRVLAREGVTIVSAKTPSEALELAELHKPKLVLLDADLRQGNGVDLAARFRGQFPEMPMGVGELKAAYLDLRRRPAPSREQTKSPCTISQLVSSTRKRGETDFLARVSG